MASRKPATISAMAVTPAEKAAFKQKFVTTGADLDAIAAAITALEGAPGLTPHQQSMLDIVKKLEAAVRFIALG